MSCGAYGAMSRDLANNGMGPAMANAVGPMATRDKPPASSCFWRVHGHRIQLLRGDQVIHEESCNVASSLESPVDMAANTCVPDTLSGALAVDCEEGCCG
jgi:hypothetical protein